MERKIGEIFEYNGEWLQCVQQPKKYDKTVCALCAFQGNGNCELDRCSGTYRSDKKFVIFKKLEKVGETITVNGKNVQLLKTNIANCDNCAFYKDLNCDFTCYPRKCYGGEEGTYVEIKNKEDMGDNDDIRPYDELFSPGTVSNTKYLTKEDMEEKKVKLDKLVTDYTSNKITYNEFEKAVKELYADKEESKPSLKSFSLEAAKQGNPVCTRDGRKARIICFDSNGGRPIVALVTECDDEEEIPYKYHCDGSYNCQSIPSDKDLMMLPKKRIGWITINKDAGLFKSKEEAERYCTKDYATVRVEFEI